MDQELCLVWLYCVIDGTLRSMIGTGRLRRRGPEPDLTDAEVLTLQIWGEMRGLASDAAIWRDATANLWGWFPRLVSYVQWIGLPIIGILFSNLPALDAQTRLLTGRYLEYRVTEKA